MSLLVQENNIQNWTRHKQVEGGNRSDLIKRTYIQTKYQNLEYNIPYNVLKNVIYPCLVFMVK